MSSSRNRNFVLRNPVVVDIGCNCRRTKFFSLFSSSSSSSSSYHSKSKYTTLSSSTTTPTATAYNSSSWDTSFTTNSLYEEYTSPLPPPPPSPSTVLNEGRLKTNRDQRRKKKKKKKNANGGRVARESVAVAVESNEPYEDFRDSMVQMIVEKDIYAWDDLNDLLHEFLSLNSPRHHPLIIHAFADLWNGLFSPPSPCL